MQYFSEFFNGKTTKLIMFTCAFNHYCLALHNESIIYSKGGYADFDELETSGAVVRMLDRDAIHRIAIF